MPSSWFARHKPNILLMPGATETEAATGIYELAHIFQRQLGNHPYGC
jgi:hypothetical protein